VRGDYIGKRVFSGEGFFVNKYSSQTKTPNQKIPCALVREASQKKEKNIYNSNLSSISLKNPSSNLFKTACGRSPLGWEYTK